jgi:uncharacterized damage-inducible protein DinB
MIESAQNNLNQLQNLLLKLSYEDYNSRPAVLFGASIGDHYRHILEFYLLLVSGSFTGLISYDRRERDQRLAEQTQVAIETIGKIESGLKNIDLGQSILMEADYTHDGSQDNKIPTSIGRELAYCIEHSIHHQAIIKAALIAIGREKLVDEQFGVAYSTIRHRKEQCAQ